MKRYSVLATMCMAGWVLFTGLLLIRSATFGVRLVAEVVFNQRLPVARPDNRACDQEFERLSEIDQQYCRYQTVEALCPSR